MPRILKITSILEQTSVFITALNFRLFLFLNVFVFVFPSSCSAGYQAQDRLWAMQEFYHWATLSAPLIHF